MSNFRTMKPRPAGSVYDAITLAYGQIDGGVTKAAEALNLSRPHVTGFSDPDAEGPKRVNMSLMQAGVLSSEAGCTALAEWLAIKAGGVFLPCPADVAGSLQDAIAHGASETGEAISASVLAAVASTCLASKDVARRELREGIAALTTILAHMDAEAAKVVSIKGAA